MGESRTGLIRRQQPAGQADDHRRHPDRQEGGQEAESDRRGDQHPGPLGPRHGRTGPLGAHRLGQPGDRLRRRGPGRTGPVQAAGQWTRARYLPEPPPRLGGLPAQADLGSGACKPVTDRAADGLADGLSRLAWHGAVGAAGRQPLRGPG